MVSYASGSYYSSNVGSFIRLYTTVNINTGNSIQYISDPAAGDKFVIKNYGVYFIFKNGTTSGSNLGVSLNSHNLTTAITSLTGQSPSGPEALCWMGGTGALSICVTLRPGDIIRSHDSATGTLSSSGAGDRFVITRLS